MDYVRALLFGVGATMLGYHAWKKGSRDSSLIRGTATAKIGTAAKGFAEVRGRACASATGALRDPITHQPCVWFAVQTERFSFLHKGWKTIKTARSSSPFVIDDGSGRCLVLPSEFEIDRRRENTTVKDGWNLRHKVWWVREGDPVFAIGYLRRLSDTPPDSPAAPDAVPVSADERALDLRVAEILRRWKRDPARIRRKFDADGDGTIDVQEWEAVRMAAREEAAKQQPTPRTTSGATAKEGAARAARHITHGLVKPPDGRPFLLTTYGEPGLVSRKRMQSFGGLVLFLVGVLILAATIHSCVGS